MKDLELSEITPEMDTPRKRNLEDSQDLLAESNNNISNLSSSKEGEDIEQYIKNNSGKLNNFVYLTLMLIIVTIC